MAVYYKFKSARDYDSIAMVGPFISVGTLKDKIFESKHLGRGTDFDLVVTNAQTNEEYLGEAMLIPKNTSVLICRVPGMPRMPIVTEKESKVESKTEDTPAEKSNYSAINEENDWDEFGNDLYAIPEVAPVKFSDSVPEVAPTNIADEDSKIKALIDTPAFDWQRQAADGFGPGRGFGRGMGGRMGGRGFGMEWKTPPQGYVCHRCKVPGHFIQHYPTNGDPTFDVKRVKPSTGIPKSMLMATPDGSYALPSGAVAVMKPNEAAFEKEIEGMPSTRSVGDLPPELHCPLCKEVMKDAVLTSKCCFTSFCDKCIRDQIISKAKCVCGATNVLADDLLPNKTLRNTINRILESGNSSAENGGSKFLVQDMESALNPQLKVPSPSQSAACQQERKPSPVVEETPNPSLKEKLDEEKHVAVLQQIPEKPRTAKAANVSEATFDSTSVKELASQGSMPMAAAEVQQKLAPGEAARKKKKKKVHMPSNDLWKASQDLTAESYMMPLGPSAFNPYWNRMQPGMESYTNTFAAPMPFMGYGMGPLDMPFGGVMPPDPFAALGYMMPFAPPQRDLAEFGMGMNAGPPAMSREEFEARKADLRRQRENERRPERLDFPRDGEVRSNGDISSMKSVQKPLPPASRGDQRPHHRRQPSQLSPPRQSRELQPLPRPSKRNSDHHDRDRGRDYGYYDEDDRDIDIGELRPHHKRSESSAKATSVTTAKATTTTCKPKSAAAERKANASVFSRISLAKKRKHSTATATGLPAASSGHHKSSSSGSGYCDNYASSSLKAATVTGGRKSGTMEYESSGDDRHFKRKPSTPPPAEWEADGKHSRGSRDRDWKGFDRGKLQSADVMDFCGTYNL